MEVILKQDIKGLGFKDDKVKVANVYGRNFLLPKGMAVLATASMVKMHAETMKQRAYKDQKLREEAQASAQKLSQLTIQVGAKVGESGKIFGSVTNIQIAEALLKAGFTIERKHIDIQGDGIKQTGTYKAKVRLYRDITTEITFEVVSE